MRARLFALLILVLAIGIPAGIYWYFFTQNTASISLQVTGASRYTAQLQGTLDNENLPLADRLLQLQKECSDSCTFSPVAPIRYTLTLTSSGKSSIREDIVVAVGQDMVRSYEFKDDVAIYPIDVSITGNRSIAEAVVANAKRKDIDYTYQLLGITPENTVYAERQTSSTREIGILTLEKFAPLFTVPRGVGSFAFDITGKYLIAPLFTDKTLILSLDMKTKKELPIIDVLGYLPGIEEKILTISGVVAGIKSSYGKNPRFTDWLDVSAVQRLGYIDKDDTERLALSNLPVGESVLMMLDRTTGENYVIKRGTDMQFLSFHDGAPVFFDTEGKIWQIALLDGE